MLVPQVRLMVVYHCKQPRAEGKVSIDVSSDEPLLTALRRAGAVFGHSLCYRFTVALIVRFLVTFSHLRCVV